MKRLMRYKNKGEKFLYETIVIVRFLKRMSLDMYRFVRSQSQVTKILGPLYIRSKKSIEIDITYNCNLRCHNCNRSCGLAPSNEEIAIEQIEEFINESISKNIKWQKIKILGGEPTLHTRFFTILRLLLWYKKNYNHDLHLIVATNGFGNYVKNVLAKLPKGVDVENTFKSSRRPIFFPFNLAPVDSVLYNNVDYSNGCKIISEDGIGLTPYGYYPCAVAGGIDRIFNFRIGRKKLPSLNDLMTDQLRILCRYCGHFKVSFPTRREKISDTWKIGYMLYNGQYITSERDISEIPSSNDENDIVVYERKYI